MSCAHKMFPRRLAEKINKKKRYRRYYYWITDDKVKKQKESLPYFSSYRKKDGRFFCWQKRKKKEKTAHPSPEGSTTFGSDWNGRSRPFGLLVLVMASSHFGRSRTTVSFHHRLTALIEFRHYMAGPVTRRMLMMELIHLLSLLFNEKKNNLFFFFFQRKIRAGHNNNNNNHKKTFWQKSCGAFTKGETFPIRPWRVELL